MMFSAALISSISVEIHLFLDRVLNGDEVCVAILLPRSAMAAAVATALSSRGVTWLLLDVTQPSRFHERVLQAAGSPPTLSVSAVAAACGWRDGSAVLLDVFSSPSSTPACARPEYAYADTLKPLYLAFTSGSSHAEGAPLRCVRGSAAATVSRLAWITSPGLRWDGPAAPSDVASMDEATARRLLVKAIFAHSDAKAGSSSSATSASTSAPAAMSGRPRRECIIWKTSTAFVDTIAEMLTGPFTGIDTVVVPECPAMAAAVDAFAQTLLLRSAGSSAAASSSHTSTAALTEHPGRAIFNPVMALASALHAERPTRLTLLPSVLLPLLHALRLTKPAASAVTPDPLLSLRSLILSGEPLRWRLVAELYAYLLEASASSAATSDFPLVLNVYGSAETAADATSFDCSLTGLQLGRALLRSRGAAASLTSSSASSATGSRSAGRKSDVDEDCEALVRDLTGLDDDCEALVRDLNGLVPAGVPLPGTRVSLMPLPMRLRPFSTAARTSALLSWLPGCTSPVPGRWTQLSADGAIMVSGTAVALGYIETDGRSGASSPAVASDAVLGLSGFVPSFADAAAAGRECSSGSTTSPATAGQAFVTSDVGCFGVVCQRDARAAAAGSVAGSRSRFAVTGGTDALLPSSCPCSCGAPMLLLISGRYDAAADDEGNDGIQTEASDASGPSAVLAVSTGKVLGVRFNAALIESAAVEAAPLIVGDSRFTVTVAKAWIENAAVQLAMGLCAAAHSPGRTTSAPSASEAGRLHDARSLATHLAASVAKHVRDHLAANLPRELVPAGACCRAYLHSQLRVAADVADESEWSEWEMELPAWPLLPSGKTDMATLRRLHNSKVATGPSAGTINPATERSDSLESAIGQAIVDVLKASRADHHVGVAASGEVLPAGVSFWDAGGDSLTAVMLLARLQAIADAQVASAKVPGSAPATAVGSLPSSLRLNAPSFDDLRSHATPQALAAFMRSGLSSAASTVDCDGAEVVSDDVNGGDRPVVASSSAGGRGVAAVAAARADSGSSLDVMSGTLSSRSTPSCLGCHLNAVQSCSSAGSYPVLELGKAGSICSWYALSRDSSAGSGDEPAIRRVQLPSWRCERVAPEWRDSQAVDPLRAAGFSGRTRSAAPVAPSAADSSPRAAAAVVWSRNLGKCVDAAPLVIQLPPVGGDARCVPCFTCNGVRSAEAHTACRDSERCAYSQRAIAVVGSHDCNVYGLDAATGALLWQTALPDRIEGAAALHPHTMTALVPCYDGVLYALRIVDGAVAFWFDTATGEGSLAASAATSSAAAAAGSRSADEAALAACSAAQAVAAQRPSLLAGHTRHIERSEAFSSLVLPLKRKTPDTAASAGASVREDDEESIGSAAPAPDSKLRRHESDETLSASAHAAGWTAGAGEHQVHDSRTSAIGSLRERSLLKSTPAVDAATGDVFLAGHDKVLSRLTLTASAIRAGEPATVAVAYDVRRTASFPLPGSAVATPLLLVADFNTTNGAAASATGRGSSSADVERAASVLLACTSGHLLRVDTSPSAAAAAMKLAWATQLPAPVFGTPAVFEPTDSSDVPSRPWPAVVPCADGSWRGIDLASGAVVWSASTEATVEASSSGFSAGFGAGISASRAPVFSSPAAVTLRSAASASHSTAAAVLVGSHDGIVRLLAAYSGAIIASFRPGSCAAATPEGDRDAIVAAPAPLLHVRCGPRGACSASFDVAAVCFRSGIVQALHIANGVDSAAAAAEVDTSARWSVTAASPALRVQGEVFASPVSVPSMSYTDSEESALPAAVLEVQPALLLVGTHADELHALQL